MDRRGALMGQRRLIKILNVQRWRPCWRWPFGCRALQAFFHSATSRAVKRPCRASFGPCGTVTAPTAYCGGRAPLKRVAHRRRWCRCKAPKVQHVQPLDVPVCELLQVGSRGGSWADRVGLFARAPSLHVRADIEVCVAGEDAASPQGSSTDGVARSWRARRCFRRFRTSTMEEGG